MSSDVKVLRSYLDVVAEARTFDCVVILVSDYMSHESYPSVVGSGSLAATEALWVPRLRDDLSAIERDLVAAGIPTLFVALPLPFEVGMTEWTMPQMDLSWGATGFDESAPPDESLERMATLPLVEAKLDWLNAWDVFDREIRSPAHRPLYLSIDGHLASHGNAVLGNAIAQRLEREQPWPAHP